MREQPFSKDQRLTELSLLYEITSIPAGLTDLNRVLDIVLEKACNRLGARLAAVYLTSPEQNGLQARATRGVPLELLPPLSLADLRGPLTDALHTRQSCIWLSKKHATAEDPLATYYPISSAIYLPLVVGERLIGLLQQRFLFLQLGILFLQLSILLLEFGTFFLNLGVFAQQFVLKLLSLSDTYSQSFVSLGYAAVCKTRNIDQETLLCRYCRR